MSDRARPHRGGEGESIYAALVSRGLGERRRGPVIGFPRK